MIATQIKNKINQLNLSEKINLVEDIWDSIAESNFDIPMREWQKHELDKRYEDYKNDKLQLYDWKTVHEDLSKKYK